MTKGNTICPQPFNGGGIKIQFLSEAKLKTENFPKGSNPELILDSKVEDNAQVS
jgi:hypothetical protein